MYRPQAICLVWYCTTSINLRHQLSDYHQPTYQFWSHPLCFWPCTFHYFRSSPHNRFGSSTTTNASAVKFSSVFLASSSTFSPCYSSIPEIRFVALCFLHYVRSLYRRQQSVSSFLRIFCVICAGYPSCSHGSYVSFHYRFPSIPIASILSRFIYGANS